MLHQWPFWGSAWAGTGQTEGHSWGGNTSSPSSTETINDGQFHTVELVTFDQMVNLSIDGGSPMTMDNFGKHYTLNSDAPLYVGGEDLQAWVGLQLALPGLSIVWWLFQVGPLLPRSGLSCGGHSKVAVGVGRP